MTVALESVPAPFRSSHDGKKRRRDALLFGASAALHLLVFGPMIILAQGDDLVFQLPDERPILQIQLEPPSFIRPRPQPEPQPAPVRPQAPAQVVPPKPVEAEQATEPVQQETLDSPRPMTEVWPTTRRVPQLAPQPAPPAPETLDQPGATSSLTPLDRALPSVSPLPPQPVETLEPSAPRNAPSPLSVTPPQIASSPSASEAIASATSDLPVRRRLTDEEQRALQAQAAGQTSTSSGPPSAPIPRLANPAPGAMAPPGSLGSGAPVPGVSEAWRVAPSSQSDRNARALRTSPTGCRFPERLTEGERQLCREQFNADAARGAERPISGSGNAARDARFRAEGAREMYRYEEQRRPLSGGTGNVGPQDCPGSNFGTGCAGSLLDPSMQMDSSSNVQTKRDGPRPRGVQVPGSSGAAPRSNTPND